MGAPRDRRLTGHPGGPADHAVRPDGPAGQSGLEAAVRRAAAEPEGPRRPAADARGDPAAPSAEPEHGARRSPAARPVQPRAGVAAGRPAPLAGALVGGPPPA